MILLTCFWLLQPAVAAEPIQRVESSGYTQITLRITNKDVIQVGLTQTKIDNNYRFEADLLWGFFADTSSNAVLTLISIHDEGQSIEVPLSAYVDLANVRLASIVPLPHGFCLNIYGGDTGTAYTAKLIFGNGVIISRTISDDELPEINEKTSYSFINPNSGM